MNMSRTSFEKQKIDKMFWHERIKFLNQVDELSEEKLDNGINFDQISKKGGDFYTLNGGNMKTCKTCAAWGAVKKGACDRVFWPRGDGMRFEIEVYSRNDAVEVNLMTDENFGCVLHVEKKDTY
jgi:hypothetical protein